MSYKGTKWAYEVRGLSGTEKAVLVYLGFKMNDKANLAWPKKKTIMKATGLSRSAIIRACNSLERKGFISVAEVRKYFKVYELQLTLSATQEVAFSHPRGALDTHRGCTSATPYKNRQGIDKRTDIELSDKSQEEDRGKTIDIVDEYKVIKDDLTPEILLEECRAEIAKREKVTPGVMIKYYRGLISISYPDTFQAEFTMKQVGMFSQMIKKAGHDLPLVISVVIPNWIRFIKRVEQDEGISGRHTPLKPNLPFLLKHIGHGVTFSRAHVCKTTKEEARARSRRALTRKPTKEAPKRKTLSGQAGIDVLCGKK